MSGAVRKLPFEGSKRRRMIDALREQGDMSTIELATLVDQDPVITAAQLRLLEAKGLCRHADGQERHFPGARAGGGSTPAIWTVKPPQKARAS